MLIFKKHRLAPHLSMGKNYWETPSSIFSPLHAQYGFILDAAADATNHKVPRWYGPGGEAPNALHVQWPLDEGNIWLNPPYSNPLQQHLVRKAYRESRGKAHFVVCLLPARTDTKLFHEIIQPHAQSIHFLKGRIRFLKPKPIDQQIAHLPIKGGWGQNTAPFPSMIVVL